MSDYDSNSDSNPEDECRSCSPLLESPPEIRNSIFGPLLTYSDPLPVTLSDSYDNTTFYKPPICQVCREIRYETLPVYYGVNTFEIRDPVKSLYNSSARLMDGEDDVTKHVHSIVVYPNYPMKNIIFEVTRDHNTGTIRVGSQYKHPPRFRGHTCELDFTPVAACLFHDGEPGIQDQRSLLEIAHRLQHATCAGWAAEKLKCGEIFACQKTAKKTALIKSRLMKASWCEKIGI